ncbi:MAG: hypothetical protein K8R53_12075, partial [Bacteroidales bacterium]|nr:hypothetical protein [Bacteroidales bacterium]
MKKSFLLLATLLTMLSFVWGQNPMIYWKFANPITYLEAGNCIFEFDVEAACDEPGTYHTDLRVCFEYNTQGFGENIHGNGNSSYQRLSLLLGEIAPGFNTYNVYGPMDYAIDKYLIISDAVIYPTQPFLNEVPQYPGFSGYAKFKIIVQDQNELAGIQFVSEISGIGIMNGSQYYVSFIQPVPAKYGNPPDYECVYVNDLLYEPLSCNQLIFTWTGAVNNDWFNGGNWTLGTAPAGEDVIIPDVGEAPFPQVYGGFASVGNLTINTGAKLTIRATGQLTATGLTTIDGMLHIISDNSGSSGSFIDEGGLTGTGHFQFDRFLAHGGAPDDGWHYISSPVNNTVTGDLIGYWVKEWQEPNNIFSDIDPAIDYCFAPSTFNVPVNVMQGYSVKQDTTYLLTCPGTGDIIEFGGDHM